MTPRRQESIVGLRLQISDPDEQSQEITQNRLDDNLSDKQLNEIQTKVDTMKNTFVETSELLKPASSPGKLAPECATCAQLRQDIH